MMFNLTDYRVLRQIDLNLLVVFATVFRERSVKRAAKRLFVGQSAVSMALGRLRVLFKDDLFVKVATGVEPTSKATAIEPLVQKALDLVHGAVFDATEFDPKTASRIVRLALADDLDVWLLPRLLDEIQRKAPGVILVVQSNNWYTGLPLLERGETDIAIGVLPKPGAALVSEELYRQRFVSIFDPAHVRPPLTMRRFLATPHVMASITGDLVGLVDEALRAQGKKRRLIATVSGFSPLGALVKGRPLIATLPHIAAAVVAQTYGLRTAEPPVAMTAYPVSMVWHAKSERDAALTWVREQLRAVVRAVLEPSAGAPSSGSKRGGAVDR
ncbi:LysR family transcriptional regulator [Pendulispora albinea]|uniref:LysR family transcriptional regulator n=1 Tax=Pendulispora albinea TaxID=2741071 RepID=A0ABZ2M319_9BACT